MTSMMLALSRMYRVDEIITFNRLTRENFLSIADIMLGEFAAELKKKNIDTPTCPGIYSARYASKGQECDKLLDEMKEVPDEKRTARFECWIAFMDNEFTEVVSGTCSGSIGNEKRGTNGFGYDPLFLYEGRTLAEMDADEKNKIAIGEQL